ncbi:MAG: hypothetical protein FIA99_12005 [Ruminiclostridium sp.]|nr:hypothetical protein [Ruminiclostridium sp.]
MQKFIAEVIFSPVLGIMGTVVEVNMEFRFEYEPVRFVEMLSEIRTAFPFLEEFAVNDTGERIAALSARLETVNDNNLQEFVKTLKGSELELIIKIMKDPADSKIEVLEGIIKLRFRKKLYNLCWIMLQDNFFNAGLLNAAQVLSEFMKAEYPDEFAASFLGRTINLAGSLPEKGEILLIEEKSDLGSFFRRYAILENSIFAQKLRELFFTGCEADGFVNNREPLLRHMNGDDLDSAAAVFSVYLDKLKTIQYFDTVNRMVVSRWGIPENGGELWQRLDDRRIAKFVAWQDLKRIEAHFGRESKRYKIWAGYFDRMQRIVADEAAGFLIMEFDKFVVFDGKVDGGWSYLYMKDYFEDEYTRYENAKNQGAPQWRIIPEHVASARDLVIEGVRSDIYRVGYDRVHILYLKEILKVELDPATSKKERFFMGRPK